MVSEFAIMAAFSPVEATINGLLGKADARKALEDLNVIKQQCLARAARIARSIPQVDVPADPPAIDPVEPPAETDDINDATEDSGNENAES